MFFVIKQILTFYIKKIGRNFRWLMNLSHVKFGKNSRLQFPVSFEGRGNVEFGNRSSLKRYSSFSLKKSSIIHFDDKFQIGEGTTIALGENATLSGGKNVHFENHIDFRVSGKWELGDDIYIASYSQIFPRELNVCGELKIGNYVGIGNNSIIDTCGNISIGNNVMIGAYSIIYTHDHDFRNSTIAPWRGPVKIADVVIEDGAWIGSRVTILPGVTIGKNAVIAAGSVVTKSVESNSVVAGVPAKPISK